MDLRHYIRQSFVRRLDTTTFSNVLRAAAREISGRDGGQTMLGRDMAVPGLMRRIRAVAGADKVRAVVVVQDPNQIVDDAIGVILQRVSFRHDVEIMRVPPMPDAALRYFGFILLFDAIGENVPDMFVEGYLRAIGLSNEGVYPAPERPFDSSSSSESSSEADSDSDSGSASLSTSSYISFSGSDSASESDSDFL